MSNIEADAVVCSGNGTETAVVSSGSNTGGSSDHIVKRFAQISRALSEKYVVQLAFLVHTHIEDEKQLVQIKSEKKAIKVIEVLQSYYGNKNVMSLLIEALVLMRLSRLISKSELESNKRRRLNPVVVCLYRIYDHATENDQDFMEHFCKGSLAKKSLEEAKKLSICPMLEIFSLLLQDCKLNTDTMNGDVNVNNYKFLKQMTETANRRIKKVVEKYGKEFGVTGPVQETGDNGKHGMSEEEEQYDTESDDDDDNECGSYYTHYDPCVDDEIDEAYPLNLPHEFQGLCVIIDNENFYPPEVASPGESGGSNKCPDRPGSRKDAEALRMLFSKFGFDVKSHKNRTCEQMRELFCKYSYNTDHSQYRMFVMFVLSHGEQNQIYGVDQKLLPANEMMAMFADKNRCSSLQGKPKLFFFQCCQGQIISEVEPDCAADTSYGIPGPHMLVMYPALPGYASWRNRNDGTWFIQLLCQNLDDFADDRDLLTILTKIERDIAKKKAEYRDPNTGVLKKVCQCAFVMKTLHMKVMFQRYQPLH